MKKRYLLLGVILFLLFSIRVSAESGFVQKDGKTYYYNSSGKLLKGQQYINDGWYCFDLDTGEMKTGFVKLSRKYEPSGAKTVYYNQKGKMVYGLQNIDGKKYFFDYSNGSLMKGQFYSNGWYCADLETGELKIGLTKLTKEYEPSGAKTVFYGDDGKMKYGVVDVEGKLKYFHPLTGALRKLKGQFYYDGNWYCADLETGDLKVGLTKLTKEYEPSGAKTVLYDNEGKMKYGIQKVDGKYYLFDLNTGALKKGQQYYKNHWYCFDLDTGVIKTGIVYLNKKYEPSGAKTVCYNKDGQMVYGKQKIDNKLYFFDRNTGALVKGQFYDDGWYCADLETGELKVGMTELTKAYEPSGAKTVYYGSDGKMQYGIKNINGELNYFHPSTGALVALDDETKNWLASGKINLTAFERMNAVGYNINQIKNILSALNENDQKYLEKIKYISELESLVKDKQFKINLLPRYLISIRDKGIKISNVVSYVNSNKDYVSPNNINWSSLYKNIKVVSNSDDYSVLINKQNRFPSGYEPYDLAYFPSGYYGNYQPMRLAARDAMIRMINDCSNAGNSWMVAMSNYRSEYVQRNLYNSYAATYGVSSADRFSARPSHSEHQTGLVSDLRGAGYDYTNFDKYDGYYWVYHNAHKYGYIQRYPYGKEYITGYRYESWHFRYVGVEIATIIYQNNWTLEEYKMIYD